MHFKHLLSALWRNRTGPILIALQIAIALTVLVNVAYVIQQRIEAFSRPSGVDVDNIFWVSSQGFAPDYNHDVVVRSDLQYLNAVPGVTAAAIFFHLTQTYSWAGLPFTTRPGEQAGKENALVHFMAGRGLETLGVRLIAGRAPRTDHLPPPAADFAETFAQWAPEVAVTQSFAKKLFPNGDALGKTLYAGLINKPARIVGIVEYMQNAPGPDPFGERLRNIVFVPLIPAGPRALYLVRTQPGRQAAVMAQVERELGASQPSRFIERIKTLKSTVAESAGWLRSSSIILAVVASLVLAVTAIGVFGLAAFTVTTRTRQIGTRRAIGARSRDILRYFLSENWLITTVGILVGSVLALAVGVQVSRIFESPRLPLYYLVGGIVFLWALGLLSVWVPARRAASISPAIATRTA